MKPPLVEGIDYYMESGKLVFTERYHQKRGFCCNSKCRHCPYGNARVPRPVPVSVLGADAEAVALSLCDAGRIEVPRWPAEGSATGANDGVRVAQRLPYARMAGGPKIAFADDALMSASRGGAGAHRRPTVGEPKRESGAHTFSPQGAAQPSGGLRKPDRPA